ncbi:hypothetical protein L9F63_003293, partial [Diploptera punctata]
DFWAVGHGREACSSPTFRQRLRLASSRLEYEPVASYFNVYYVLHPEVFYIIGIHRDPPVKEDRRFSIGDVFLH